MYIVSSYLGKPAVLNRVTRIFTTGFTSFAQANQWACDQNKLAAATA